VVDVTRLPELAGIHHDGDFLDIGAACTFAEIRHDALVNEYAPALADAAVVFGAWQIQNRATIGGNIANASPAGDSLPVLLALDAQIIVAGPIGVRIITYADFNTGYRETALGPGELIVRIHVPNPPPNHMQRLWKVGTRAAQAISKVVVAFAASRGGGRMTSVRIAAGSVAPTPIRLPATEYACEGRPYDSATADRAAATAVNEITPIDDVRSTAAYRRFVLGRIVRRFVLDMADPPLRDPAPEEVLR